LLFSFRIVVCVLFTYFFLYLQALIDSGRLRKTSEENVSFVKSTLRRFNRKNGDKLKAMDYPAEFDSDIFRNYPHSFWAYSKVIYHSFFLLSSDKKLISTSLHHVVVQL